MYVLKWKHLRRYLKIINYNNYIIQYYIYQLIKIIRDTIRNKKSLYYYKLFELKLINNCRDVQMNYRFKDNLIPRCYRLRATAENTVPISKKLKLK